MQEAVEQRERAKQLQEFLITFSRLGIVSRLFISRGQQGSAQPEHEPAKRCLVYRTAQVFAESPTCVQMLDDPCFVVLFGVVNSKLQMYEDRRHLVFRRCS